jgi:hypothetical protein
MIEPSAFEGHNLSCYVTCVALLLVDVLEHHHPTLADDPLFEYYTLGQQAPKYNIKQTYFVKKNSIEINSTGCKYDLIPSCVTGRPQPLNIVQYWKHICHL